MKKKETAVQLIRTIALIKFDFIANLITLEYYEKETTSMKT